MPRKRHSPEQILRKLREVEVALAKGETVARAVRQIAVTEQTYYRWRNKSRNGETVWVEIDDGLVVSQ